MRIRRARRLGPLAAAALVLGIASSPAGGQGEPPCPPDVLAQPVFGSADYPSGGHHLFATHPVTIGAGFPAAGPTATVTGFSAAGLTPVTDEFSEQPFGSFDGDVTSITVRGDQPGSYPATVTWTQNDAAENTCAGSASTSVALAAATPPRLTKPRVTPGLNTESVVKLRVPAGGDLRPVEIRYRAVAKRRFPGSGARAHKFTFPLIKPESDDGPLFHGSVRVGGLKLLIGTDPQFTFTVRARPRGTPYGYDLQILQGGRRVSRLRVSGRCARHGGLVTCKRKLRLS